MKTCNEIRSCRAVSVEQDLPFNKLGPVSKLKGIETKLKLKYPTKVGANINDKQLDLLISDFGPKCTWLAPGGAKFEVFFSHSVSLLLLNPTDQCFTLIPF